MIAKIHILNVLFKLKEKEKKSVFFPKPVFTQLMALAGKGSYCSYSPNVFSPSVFL